MGSATLPLAADGTFLVITDLVLRFADASGPTRVIRIPGTKLGLTALFPALAPQVAYRELLGRLLAHTQLSALPDRASLEEGRLPAFDSSAQLDAAFYPEQLAKP